MEYTKAVKREIEEQKINGFSNKMEGFVVRKLGRKIISFSVIKQNILKYDKGCSDILARYAKINGEWKDVTNEKDLTEVL